MKVKILSAGRKPDTSYQKLLDHYTKCLSPSASLEIEHFKNARTLESALKKEPHIICLDAEGQVFDSKEFSEKLIQEIESRGARVTLAIGPAEGFSQEVKAVHKLWSLSKLTLPHDMALLVLTEQIYRAFEIKKGSERTR